jgi:hypothetical protein
MSSLRPIARTTAPDGREWEIYAYGLRLPPRKGRLWIFRRIFFDIPLASLHLLQSDVCLVEAVSWAPYPIRLRWEISKDRKGQALAQVEGQLARGERPMLRNAKQLLY